MAVEQKSTNAYTNLKQFMARIRDVPLARTERFECTFKLPPSLTETILGMKDPEALDITCQDQEYFMSLMCEEVQIPGMVLQNKEVPIGAWNFMRNSNVNYLGNEINITFLTDETWQLRHLFEAWIAHCVNPTSKEIAFPDDQYGTIWINVLDWSGDEKAMPPGYEGLAWKGTSPEQMEALGLGTAVDVPGERVMTQWELLEVTPKVLNLIPLGAMNVGIARTTLIISSAYWRSRTIDVNLGAETIWLPDDGEQ